MKLNGHQVDYQETNIVERDFTENEVQTMITALDHYLEFIPEGLERERAMSLLEEFGDNLKKFGDRPKKLYFYEVMCDDGYTYVAAESHGQAWELLGVETAPTIQVKVKSVRYWNRILSFSDFCEEINCHRPFIFGRGYKSRKEITDEYSHKWI